MSSYTTLQDQDLSEDALHEMARADAALQDRIDAFRQQGRLLTRPDTLSAAANITNHLFTYTEPKRLPNTWDDIVATVIAGGRFRRVNGRQIASQIASKIQTYWDGHAARKDKARMQEEKRLRGLAKATIKMVTNEWKKAIFVRSSTRLFA